MKVPSTKDQVTIPWLNEIFSPRGIQIVSFTWAGPANNGLGCMSTLERLSLQVTSASETKTLNLILKTLPTDPGVRHYVTSSGYANREFQMYTKLFQDWNNFLDKRSIPQEHRFRAPLCYYGAEEGEGDELKQILILEDLFQSKFSVWTEGFGKSLTWTEAKPLIRLVALFHATGIGYKIHSGFKSYRDLYPFLHMNDADMNFDYYIKSGFDATIQMLREFHPQQEGSEDCEILPLPVPDGLIDQLEIFRENAHAILKNYLEPKEGEVATVCHNDLHVNNFMLSRDNNNYEAVIFDFQAASNLKPMKDLSFLLILNCDTSLITSHLPKVLQYYHDVFHGAMNAMKIPMDYSLEKITEEYKSTAFLSIVHIIAGAVQWCFGAGTNNETKRRFRSALIHMFNDGILISPDQIKG